MVRWNAVLALCVILEVSATVQAQQGQPKLTPQDYAEIMQLNSYWIHGSSSGDREITMRGFAPGGVVRRPAGLGRCESTPYCEDVIRPVGSVLPSTPAIPDFPYAKAKLPACRHSTVPGCVRNLYVLDTIIEQTAEGAKGLSHVVVMEKDPGKPAVTVPDSGAYIDTYVKDGGRWGIKIKAWFPFSENGNPYQSGTDLTGPGKSRPSERR